MPITITTEHGKNLWKNNIHHLIERHLISPLATMRVAVSKDIRDIRVTDQRCTLSQDCGDPSLCERSCPGRRIQTKKPGEDRRCGPNGFRQGLPHASESVLKGFERKAYLPNCFFSATDPKGHVWRNWLTTSEFVTKCGSWVSKTNVQSWLRKFDLIAFSSVREGIPVAMLEAMAAGVPVVATRAGGIPEVIRDGVEGLLVDCRQPSLLASALLKMGRDLGLRRKIGSEGRKRIISDYSRETICLQYLRLYQLLLRQGDNFGR